MNRQKDAITMRCHSKKRETMGNVEFKTVGERLALRYTPQCTIPRVFWRRSILPLDEIESVLRVGRSAGCRMAQ